MFNFTWPLKVSKLCAGPEKVLKIDLKRHERVNDSGDSNKVMLFESKLAPDCESIV